ncbi:MAG: nucleoid occlusion protein [Syntrophomonas sp.]|uniref:nucleoid occlusion protein n=1 Tax=Syntrophomonas sp. TaxID=2053627 RepID=UPI002638453C|nr:nucleoid occlusion protein [Syntrophomonas sp.]MDD2510573.1 nucleoid occlusion protein [Syntrophomonas sp.]MDD4626306.1 nucleoid occlusion protein [Syntrophomonas sp.]
MVLKQLERLLGKSSEVKVTGIPVEKLYPNPFQPRKDFDERELMELAQSIEAYGIIQPIIVRPREEGFQIIAGERRFRACCLLGIREIPAIIQEMDDEKVATVSLIENLQRRELNYFEEANAYSKLINGFGLTQEELARKIGKSQAAIANKIRLLKLPLSVRSLILPERISERHARALLKLNSAEMQLEVVKQIYEKELTVKETEELVDGVSRNNIPQEIGSRPKGQSVSMVIRDARIFLNTIRETVKRARQTGIDIVMVEKDVDSEYEITIRIGKHKKNQQLAL